MTWARAWRAQIVFNLFAVKNEGAPRSGARQFQGAPKKKTIEICRFVQ
jgi:hypothetical protein